MLDMPDKKFWPSSKYGNIFLLFHIMHIRRISLIMFFLSLATKGFIAA